MGRGFRKGWSWTRHSRGVARGVKVVAFAVLGAFTAGVGMLLTGSTQVDIGPFETTVRVSPSTHGESQVVLPPLGSLSFDSHSGPLKLTLQLDSLNEDRTQDLITDPEGIQKASQTVPGDLSDGVTDVALNALGGAILAGLIAGGLLFRDVRRTAVCGGLSLLMAATALGTAAATIRPQSLTEPRYEGLLVNAPIVVGDAKTFADRYEKYQRQLQTIIINMSQFYNIGKSLPGGEPDEDTVRVLHVSDLHLNPASFEVMESVVDQFAVDAVADTGDITDWGSRQEAESYTEGIGDIEAPYVFIRGNHDSAAVADAVADQDNAVVLNNEVREVEGLRFAGIRDPRFTPDKSSAPSDIREEQVLLDSGNELAGTIRDAEGADLAMVHDPASASPLAGEVPLVLAGHTHTRQVSKLSDDTLLQVEGSTGGAGLRGLDDGEPVPLAMSILYFDKDDSTLLAFDDITMGGAGQTQVTLQRHLLTDGMPDDNSDLIPNPDEVDAQDEETRPPDND